MQPNEEKMPARYSVLRASLGLLPLLWAAPLFAAAEEPAPDWLHTDGRWIKDSRGDIQKLYGVNTVVRLKNERAKFEAAGKQGFNTIRLMLFKQDIEKPVKDFPDQDRSGLEAIDKVVKWCQELRMRVILDHQIWGKDIEPAPTDFLTNEKQQAEWLNMWRLLVDRYKNNSTVVGIDLMNEPNGLKHKMKLPASVADPQGAWEGVAKNAIKELKAVNPKLLFIVEDFGRTNAPNGLWRDVKFLKENNGVYSSHIYYSGHKQWNPWGKAYASGDFETGKKLLGKWMDDNYAKYAAEGVPVWMGEIGFRTDDPHWQQEMTDEMQLFDERGIGYALYSYAVWPWPEPFDIVDRSAAGYQLTKIGQIFSTHVLELAKPKSPGADK
jgi:hypothetical protein